MLLVNNVHIISASEGFDTSSPWGIAILNILMIFAQLERSNTSERIHDTMLHYARQGRWTGGLAPTGFKSAQAAYTDSFGQVKSMAVLVPVESEVSTVKTIYGKYIELKSLSLVKAFLSKARIKTRNDKYFSEATIRDLLINPVYAAADKDLYEYFSKAGSEICGGQSEFNGSSSVMPYNREDKKKRVTRPVSQWIVALSSHAGIISGKDWVKVQQILKANSVKKPRLGTAETGAFSGLIRCKNCGSTMRIKKGRISSKTGEREFYYVCSLKEKSGSAACGTKNLPGHTIERLIIEKIEDYAVKTGLSKVMAKRSKIICSGDIPEKQATLDRLKKELSHNENTIKNLVAQSSQISGKGAGLYLLEKIEETAGNIARIKEAVKEAESELALGRAKASWRFPPERTFKKLKKFENIMAAKTKQALIRLIISYVEWDGESLFVRFAVSQP